MNAPLTSTLPSLLLATLLAGCATGGARNAAVPANLQPAGERQAFTLAAEGVQIYECRAKAGAAGQFEWAFVAPDAKLRTIGGADAGKHYAGPVWEAPDGSKTQGAVTQRADATHAGAIPWLLLTTKPAGGNGRFTNVSSIQRLNTHGGSAPKDGCTQAALGTQARVPYTADYVFFTR